MPNGFERTHRIPGGRGRLVTGLLMVVGIGGCGGAWIGIPGLDTPDGRIFAQRCAACHLKPFGNHALTHGVPDPRLRTMAEWRAVLPKMDRLREDAGLPSVTEADREAITRYLGRHAQR